MPRYGVRAFLTAVVATALTTLGAYAQDSVPNGRRLLLLPAACNDSEVAAPYVIDDSMLAVLRVELSPAQVVVVGEAELRTNSDESDIIRLSVCGDLAKVARMTDTTPQEAQTVDLSGLTGGARARTLALVLSGLRSTPEAPALTPPEAAPTVNRPSRFTLDPELKPRPPTFAAPSPGTELGGSAEMRTYPAPNTVMYGLRVIARFPRYLLGAVVLLSRERQEEGVVSLGMAAGTMGYALVRRARHTSLGLDLFGELGATWASGSAVSAAARGGRTALHASAVLRPWLHVRLSQQWVTTVALLVGYSRGLQAKIASERVATSHGPFVGVSLGGAFRGAR